MAIISNCALQNFALDTDGLTWWNFGELIDKCSLCLELAGDSAIFLRNTANGKELRLHRQCFNKRLISMVPNASDQKKQTKSDEAIIREMQKVLDETDEVARHGN